MITDHQRQLEVARRQSVARVVQRVRECLEPGSSAFGDDVLGQHPLAALFHRLALRDGPAARSRIRVLNETLSARIERDAERIRKGRLIALQSLLVLPDRETRDAELGTDPIAEVTLEELLDRFAAAVWSSLPEWWSEYVGIAASYTAVTINGRSAPMKFSGTYSDATGAVHGAVPSDVETYVEILTHEAGHLWLNLIADRDPDFIRNPYTDRRFVSPWRGDVRPIHGIVHGAYVFSVVIPALLALRTDPAKSRAVQLAVEVQDAVRQVHFYGCLSTEAIEVVRSSEARVRDLEQDLGMEALKSAKSIYIAAKERKISRLKQCHPELQVAWGGCE